MTTKGTEAHFWASLRKNIPAAHWQRIESPTTGAGIPDVHGCLDGVSAWIELKIIRGKRVLLTPQQCNWLCGYPGRCFVVAQHVPTNYIYAWPGEFAREVRADGMDADGRRSIKDWKHLEAMLFHLQ